MFVTFDFHCWFITELDSLTAANSNLVFPFPYLDFCFFDGIGSFIATGVDDGKSK